MIEPAASPLPPPTQDVHMSSRGDHLPPITTETPPTALQMKIARQSWDQVSARQPIGSRDHPPDRETFVEHASTILEARLADVARARLDATPPSCSSAEGEVRLVPLNDSFTEKQLEETAADSPTVLLTSACRSQLRGYVRRIASMYRENRYHGLEHAVHVTMSANKLLDMLYEWTVESDDDEHDFACSEPHILRPLHDDSTRSGKRERVGGGEEVSISERSGSMRRSSSFSDELECSNRQLPRRHHKPRSSTYCIYTDAFAKFAFVFAALIHDVDHQGVPNKRLVVEHDPLVGLHGDISTAEKHSIQVAFRTLGEDGFDDFRSLVLASPDERLQLHRIVTNLVLSTDIASPERMQHTKVRWEEAFAANPHPPSGLLPLGKLSLAGQEPPLSEIATVQASKPQLVPMEASAAAHPRQPRRNSFQRLLRPNQTVEYYVECNDDDDDARTALRHGVVMETMINVADVAHAMQSWELFLFWNRRLYEELHDAYQEGRSDVDPSREWYENQLGFYRLYIIPLAEKMDRCGAFGDLGGEWVKNAILIRDRWKREGERVTRDMISCSLDCHKLR